MHTYPPFHTYTFYNAIEKSGIRGTDMCYSATVVSIIRLQYLINFHRTKNPTWDYWNITKWSAIELAVGIVCTCIPSIRMVMARLLPGRFSSTRETDHKRHRYNGGSGKIMSNSSFVLKGNSQGRDLDGKNITCTKTFTVEGREDDEMELVRVPKSSV